MLLERSLPDPSHLAGLAYTTRQLAAAGHTRHGLWASRPFLRPPAGLTDGPPGRGFRAVTVDQGQGQIAGQDNSDIITSLADQQFQDLDVFQG